MSEVSAISPNLMTKIWCGSDTTKRVESLFEFIIGKNLVICQRGYSPNLVTAVRGVCTPGLRMKGSRGQFILLSEVHRVQCR